MKRSIRFICCFLSIAQATTPVFCGRSAVFASSHSALSSSDQSQSDSQRIDSFERTVFGETHAGKSVSARMAAMEVSLFGKAGTGGKAQRLEAIGKALSTTSGNVLMPALAPQMDTSQTQAKSDALPSPAPYNDAQEAAADRAKSELKEAMGLYARGDLNQAQQAFQRVLAIDGHNADAYYNLGVIAEGRNDLQAALSNYRAALNINPSDRDLRNAVTSVQGKIDQNLAAERQSREQQAAAAKQAQDERTKQNLQQYTASAAAAFKDGNYDRSIGDLEIVARQAPGDADVQYALAQAYRGKGDLNSARVHLNRAISLNPANQMYASAMSELDHQVAESGGSGGAPAGRYPSPAPDFRSGVANDSFGHNTFANTPGSAGQTVGFGQDGSNSSAPVGQITPFSESGDSSSRYPGLQRGFAYGGGYRDNGGGFGYSYSSGSSRLRRAAISGLTGAAMGAAMSSMFSAPGYRGKSMMRGALLGGALGVFSGGLFSRY